MRQVFKFEVSYLSRYLADYKVRKLFNGLVHKLVRFLSQTTFSQQELNVECWLCIIYHFIALVFLYQIILEFIDFN
jgi:hypothetical protein